MKSTKIALIGCGAAALRYYVSPLQKYREDIDDIFLIDIDADNAVSVQQALGWGQVHTKYQEVLSDVHGAIILLPNDLHHAVAIDCLNAGVNVLCEKPLAVLPQHAREIVEAAERNGVALCMNNTRRMFPNFQAVKKAIDLGQLGRVREIEYVEGNTFGWQSVTGFLVNPKISSKGILLDLGSHVIDTLTWWLGGKPDLEEFVDDSYGGPESVAKIRAHKDDCKINITLNRLVELGNTYKVVGEKQTIEGNISNWKQLSVIDRGGKVNERKLSCAAKNYPAFVSPIVKNFIETIAGSASPLVSGKDVLPSIEFIDDCYGSRKHFSFSWDREIAIPRPRKAEDERGDKKRILVTGATGFIGGRAMEIIHLAEDEGFSATAGIRQWSSAGRLGRLPAEIVTMDLLDKAQVEKALEGITHVIHCAKGTPEDTVEGTRNLLDISLSSGIQHVIHLSTAEVYGDATGVVDEEYPNQYTGNAYNKMKIDAEKVCFEYMDKGLPITVFRPAIVYGPYSNSWCWRFASLMLSGEWGKFEKYGEGKCNLVYVDDLVMTLITTLSNQEAVGKALNVNGPEITTWNEYFSRLNEMMGLPSLKLIKARTADKNTYVMAPVRILGGVVKKHFLGPVKKAAELSDTVDAMLRRLQHQATAKPPAAELKLYSKDVKYSDALARKLLDYCPDTPLERGMQESVDWLRYLGTVPD